jgi:hypothetical protein
MEFAELNFDPLITNGESPAHKVIERYFDLFNNDKPLVICVGDSFSHGHGTADCTLPGYPGDLTSNEYDSITPIHRNSLLHKIKNSNLKITESLWPLERKNAWPNQLQTIRPDLQVLNLSIPGGSVERAARLLIEWSLVVKLFFPNRKITLICGNSFHWRHELLSVHGYAMCIPGTVPGPGQSVEKMLHDLCVKHWDEEIHTHYYFKEVSWLISMAKLNKFNLLFLSYDTTSQIEQGEIFKRYESMLTGQWPGTIMLDEGEFSPDDKVVCFDGHYTVMVYKNVARKISCLI